MGRSCRWVQRLVYPAAMMVGLARAVGQEELLGNMMVSRDPGGVAGGEEGDHATKAGYADVVGEVGCVGMPKRTCDSVGA